MTDQLPELSDDQIKSGVDSLYGDQNQALRESIMAGQKMAPNPDTAAKALPLAQDRGIPLDMAMRNQAQLAQEKQAQDVPYEQLVKQYPQLSQFLANPENAAIAHDDVPALQKVGDWSAGLKDHLSLSGAGDFLQNRLATVSGFIGSGLSGAGQEFKQTGFQMYQMANRPDAGGTAFDRFMIKAGGGVLGAIGSPMILAGEQYKALQGKLHTGDDGLLGSVSDALINLAGFGAAEVATAGSATGPLMAAQSFDTGNELAKQQGLEGTTRGYVGAQLDAAIGTLLTRIPFEAVTKGLPESWRVAMGNTIGAAMMKYGVNPGGAAATVTAKTIDAGARALEASLSMMSQQFAQNLVGTKVLNSKEPLSKGVADQGITMGIASFLGSLLMQHFGGARVNFNEEMNKYRTEQMQAGRDAVAQAKTMDRAPDKMNEYLREELRNPDGSDRQIYLNAGAAETFYHSLSDEDKAALDKSMPEFGKQVAESRTTGEDLQMDQADYHTYVQQLEGSKNLDQWVKWIPESSSEGDDKAHAEFVKGLYADLDKAQDKEDPVAANIYRQLIQRYGERTAVSGGTDVARLLSQNPADFYRTMMSRMENVPGAKEVLDRMIGGLQFAREYPALNNVVRQGADATDLLIDRIRQDKQDAADRTAAAEARAKDVLEQTGKAVAGKMRDQRKSTPVMDYIKGLGGIREGSTAAKDLEARGVTKKQFRTLFSKDGLRGLDNLPVSEFNDYGHDFNLEGKALPTHEGDTDAHYLDPEYLYGEIEKEAAGRGAKTREQAAYEAQAADLLHVADVMGLDFDKASNKQIKDALDAYSKSFGVQGQDTLFQKTTSSPEFKNWFGASKVVDDAGAPKVVYHGTGRYPFTSFDTEDFGAWFSEDTAISDKYTSKASDYGFAHPNTYPVFLKAEKPFIIPDTSDMSGESTGKVIVNEINKVNGTNFSAKDLGIDKKYTGFNFEHIAYNQKLFQALKEAGFDSVMAHENGVKTWNVFSPEQIKSVHNNGSFSPNNPDILNQGGGEGKPRGSITFTPDGSPLIHLFEKENLSTVLHEYGHLYWRTLSELSGLEKAPGQLIADVNAIREWVGAKPGDKLSVEHEEKIADGFLTYLRDNEAPSIEVRSAFQRFKSWLTGIYQGARDTLPKISKDVKETFDRMFATDAEIKKLKETPQFSIDPRLAEFLTEGQKAQAQRKLDRMVGEASDNLFRKAMRETESQGTQEYKDLRAGVQAETEKTVQDDQRYQALTVALAQGLDRKAAKKIYGDYADQALAYLKQHRGLFKAGGADPDAVAALHGFNSGRELLDAFQKMAPRKDYIAQQTDAEMIARHGDMLNDGTLPRAAVDAYHNGMRTKMLEWEMKQTAQLAKIPAPSGQAMEMKARQVLNDRVMSQIVPSRFYTSELAAAKAFGEALGKKDFEGAAVAKAQQLLNHHLYSMALDARDLRDSRMEKWGKLFRPDEKLAKSMDMDYVNAGRAILSAHGMGNGKFDFPTWYAHLSQDDPETTNAVREIIEYANLGSAKKIKEMTLGEFQGLADNMDALMHIAKDSKTITIAGQRLDKALTVQELTDKLANQDSSGIASGMAGKISKGDQMKKGILGIAAYLRRAENQLTALDGYEADGPFNRFIWKPVKDAAENFRDVRDDLMQKALTLLKEPLESYSKEKIPAPELVSETTGEHYTFENKAELVGMLQHLGNGFEPGSNGYKLLRGYGWSPDALDAFLARAHRDGLVTKADWDLVQKIWDLYGSQKNAVWKAHREMRGFYPSEIDAVPFKTPFGEYAGGYAPAVVDRLKSSAIADKELQNQITNEDNNFAFPTTGRGATMQRVATAAYPLEMNLQLLPKHLEWTAKYTTIEPVIKQVAKVMFDREFKAEMDRVNPATVSDLLVPWLQRTARQSMNMQADKTNPVMAKTAAYLRKNSQLQALGFNPIYMFQRIGSIGPIVQTAGAGNTMSALIDLIQNRGDLREQIQEESGFMRHRNNMPDENYQQAISRLLEDRGPLQKVGDWASDHGYIIQHITHGFLDDLQYLAGKYQAQAGEAAGVDPEDAAAVQDHAEKAVRMTQGSFHPEDASRVEARGDFWSKVGTVFYGIMNTQGNFLYDEGRKIKESDASGFSKGMSGLHLYTMGYAVPAFVAAAVMDAFRGGTPPGQDPEKHWLQTFIGSQVSYGMGMLPWIREMANPVINRLEDRKYDDSVALGGSVKDFLQKVFVDTPGDLKDYLLKNGSGKKVLNDMLSDLGYALQIPVTAARRAINYGIAVHQGKDQADNPAQVIRGVIGGPRARQ